MKVIEMKKDAEIIEVLEDVKSQAGNLKCIVVLGLYHDTSQMLRTSNSSAIEKSFLLAFFQAWMAKWFNLFEG